MQRQCGGLHILPVVGEILVAMIAGQTLAMTPTTQSASEPGPATKPATASVQETYSRPVTESPGALHLKKLSLEDLMDVEVTSVSRQESTVAQSPAAITVITQDMIRRSGATTIQELFRMVRP